MWHAKWFCLEEARHWKSLSAPSRKIVVDSRNQGSKDTKLRHLPGYKWGIQYHPTDLLEHRGDLAIGVGVVLGT